MKIGNLTRTNEQCRTVLWRRIARKERFSIQRTMSVITNRATDTIGHRRSVGNEAYSGQDQVRLFVTGRSDNDGSTATGWTETIVVHELSAAGPHGPIG
jgi:hypothetical protein